MKKYSKKDFSMLGLQQAGYSIESIRKSSRAENDKRLKDYCYATTTTLSSIFLDIQDPTLNEFCIHKPNPSHLISALYFLKKYPTIHELAARCGTGTEKTMMNRVWQYVKAIQALKANKIQWIFDDTDAYKEFFILSVDGVHCRIYEPRIQPSSGWYSKKFNKAGLVYELGVAIYHDKIVWINGPYPAGQNDMKVFCKPGGLMEKIPDGRRAIGDEGYRGKPLKVSTKNKYNSEELSKFSSRVRARHETVNSRLKSFGILSQVFRSKGERRMEKHKSVFEACCVIVQYELDHGSKLFKV